MYSNNLAQEWRALRRSFRYNDYGKISAKNPAQGPVSKVRHTWRAGRSGTMSRKG